MMNGDIHFKDIYYGFEYGSATVERMCSDGEKGWVVMHVTTPRAEIQVYVTKTGKLRVFDYKNGGELKCKR